MSNSIPESDAGKVQSESLNKAAEEQQSRYAKRGVSASKSEVHEAIKNMDKGLYPTAFCKVLPDIAGGDPEWCNLMHADTAGTKTSLAYLYWKETGDLSVWSGIAQDALVMNLDDMGCVGALSDIIISSTIGRNKHRVPGSVIKALIEGTNAFISSMSDLGVTIHHAGGETADVGDIVRTVDVGFTAFARLPRDKVLVNHIKPGCVIVGLSSYGQASYESFYNGGMGSNGLTSARHDLFTKTYAEKYPESFAPGTDMDVVYSGPYKLEDKAGDTDRTMGQLVLSPTRTYLPFLARAVESHRDKIQGIIHCTGGAQTKVLHFLEPQSGDMPGLRIIKDNLLEVPPLFRMIQEASGTDWKEMYKVFNMGHRLECYVEEEIAPSLIAMARELDIEAKIIGRCEAAPSHSVSIKSPHGEFEYA
ncbi:MAG: phosphoribosylformylglycinamidine cyclo-ligase [Limisphaerales bacterium]|jgi:phosphoribosylformylglycinamidine cyclo-ligase